MLEKTLHFLETAAVFHSEPAYNLPCLLVKKEAKISFLSAGITLVKNRAVIPKRSCQIASGILPKSVIKESLFCICPEAGVCFQKRTFLPCNVVRIFAEIFRSNYLDFSS